MICQLFGTLRPKMNDTFSRVKFGESGKNGVMSELETDIRGRDIETVREEEEM